MLKHHAQNNIDVMLISRNALMYTQRQICWYMYQKCSYM